MYLDAQGKLIALKRNNVIQTGSFGITNTGAFGLIQGNIYSSPQTQYKYQGQVKDGQTIELKVDIDGNELKIRGNNNQSAVFNKAGELVDGTIDFGKGAYSFMINAGNWTDIFISTAQAAEMPGIFDPITGQFYKPTNLDPKNINTITSTQTRRRTDDVQFLVRFVGDREFIDDVKGRGLLSANAIGKLFTTDSLNLNDTEQKAAYTNQLFKKNSTGNLVFDPERAYNFVVFDTENLNPTYKTKQKVHKYLNEDGTPANPLLENTGRNELIFEGAPNSPIINLNDTLDSGDKRLIHKGTNKGFFGILERLYALAEIYIIRGLKNAR